MKDRFTFTMINIIWLILCAVLVYVLLILDISVLSLVGGILVGWTVSTVLLGMMIADK